MSVADESTLMQFTPTPIFVNSGRVNTTHTFLFISRELSFLWTHEQSDWKFVVAAASESAGCWI